VCWIATRLSIIHRLKVSQFLEKWAAEHEEQWSQDQAGDRLYWHRKSALCPGEYPRMGAGLLRELQYLYSEVPSRGDFLGDMNPQR